MKFKASDLLMQGTNPPPSNERDPWIGERCVVSSYDKKGNPCTLELKFMPHLVSVMGGAWLSADQLYCASNEMTRLYRIRKLARKTAKKFGVDAKGWLGCCNLNRFTEEGYLQFLEMAKIPYKGELAPLKRGFGL